MKQRILLSIIALLTIIISKGQTTGDVRVVRVVRTADVANPLTDAPSLHPPQHVGPPRDDQAVTNRAQTGIPSLAVAQKGRLWATWYAGVTPDEDFNNYVVLFTSNDDGATWQEVLKVDPDGQQTPEDLIRIIYDYNRETDRNILMATFREEEVAAGKPVSNDVRLRQLVSKGTGGQEKPKTSTAPVHASADCKSLRNVQSGTLVCDDVKLQPLVPGAKLFTDHTYIAAELPAALKNAHFLSIALEGQKTLKCERAGTVFFLTPLLERNRDTAAQPLMDQGFEKVALPEIPLFNPDSTGNFCTLFQKDCAVGETILIDKWAMPVFFP